MSRAASGTVEWRGTPPRWWARITVKGANDGVRPKRDPQWIASRGEAAPEDGPMKLSIAVALLMLACDDKEYRARNLQQCLEQCDSVANLFGTPDRREWLGKFRCFACTDAEVSKMASDEVADAEKLRVDCRNTCEAHCGDARHACP
jgi:hypothetical protein